MADSSKDINQKVTDHLAIFRVGEVIAVNGRGIIVKVDSNKNLPHILFQGQLIKGVAVGSYVKIKKGFSTFVGKVESEELKENRNFNPDYHKSEEEFIRCIYLKLIGFFDAGKYKMGVREMPLIGNVCYLLTPEEFTSIHSFCSMSDETITLGHLLVDDQVPVKIGANKLFTSHLGIFGNTGSGKSYTLASVLKGIFDVGAGHKNFVENSKFVVFDFNGEYSSNNTISPLKEVYRLSTRTESEKKIPLAEEDLLNPEIFFILASATEKTQQPFIRRTIDFYKKIHRIDGNINAYLRGILKNQLLQILTIGDGQKAQVLLSYLNSILKNTCEANELSTDLKSELIWHSNKNIFYVLRGGNKDYIDGKEDQMVINTLQIHKAIKLYGESDSFVGRIIEYMYMSLIDDVLSNRAMNEHIAPAINKLRAIAEDLDKIFDIEEDTINYLYGEGNLIIIDLNDTNTKIKKLVPLLISMKLYKEHKNLKPDKGGKLTHSLHLIIDEAHNILSYESNRESETWKDFRLEVFEEIIKEGRKFGVFLTIASQRPSDISATIISQLHNYLIHRLVNNRDLEMVEKAISYLDKVSIENLPILPVGSCVLSGTAIDLPVILQVKPLPEAYQPHSENINLIESWGDELDDDDLL